MLAMAPDTNIALLVTSTLIVLSTADQADPALSDIDALDRNVVQLYDVVQKRVKRVLTEE